MAQYIESRLRVRYAETDQMGVVYYANFFIWMEIGRTDFCRQCGFTYRDLEREEETYLAVSEASCRYLAPARYDDDIIIRTSIERLKRRTMTFAYSILHAHTGRVLAEGKTTHITLSTNARPKSLPQRYFELLSKGPWVGETGISGPRLHAALLFVAAFGRSQRATLAQRERA